MKKVKKILKKQLNFEIIISKKFMQMGKDRCRCIDMWDIWKQIFSEYTWLYSLTLDGNVSYN